MKSIVKKALGLGSIIVPIWYAIYAWPQSDESMPFFEKKKTRTYNIAHRGGAALAPEETLEAFAKSEEAGADMFEYDVHITKDGHLIASHDATVDRITTGTGYINDLTLTEIKALDAGEKFVDVNGESPYKGQGVQLATVEEIFLLFPHKRAVIELKDTNRPELYEAMNQEIWRLIQQYNMEDKVIIASFDHKINQRFKEISNGQVAIGAGESEATSYLTKMILRLNGIAHTDSQAFQLPTNQHGLDLTQKNIINGSRQRGIDVYYWTINDEETMRDLIAKGVDGIMTDNPELLEKVLNEG
ncbi:glycerophosphodiester phosphodiesterase [Aerococcaceae bacterium INB8]|uniref:Glycerophosphodiester phosphodiesterase n=1 Tax=Ruoffia halotolerans TaxID=2748684 RepID=A0A839A6L6_9LACT|nr:glycerophosphodiester phosphodiesterase [Ruoffia halotolerans]MBA5729474.1 glycerophosphodiester phosphodiesterase [Ruoffia halotolerans]